MNVMPEGIIVNSCQYTPVYLIQDPGASQGRSYFITQSNVEETKPVSDNLKAFYESSGNIENSVISVQRPRIVRKPENCVVGNNLKLASFLLPKNENVNKQQQYVLNNVVLKSNVTINNSNCTTSTVNTVPRLNIDSKIVKLNNIELKSKYQRVERSTPKTKPKEIIQNVVAPAPTKHTSVQLLKLGETYHSLNQLSDDQMKMVSQALKIFSNPEKIAPEPTYDPVTNTKFIYKVVSPKDLTVVGKNKVQANKIYEAKIDNIINNNTHILSKDTVKKDLFQKEIKTDMKKDNSIKTDIRKDNIIKTDKKDVLHKSDCKKEIKHDLKKDNLIKHDLKKDNLTKHDPKKDNSIKDHAKKEPVRRMKIKKQEGEEEKAKQKLMKELKQDEDDYYRSIAETKVTRSGRKVKFPKLNLPEDSPHKPKKKHTSVTCFQCAAEFTSLYRLQKHYESHPTHIPAKIHSNLFHCLLAIVKSGTEEDRTNIFIQQLEQLIVKLRSLLPCLVRKKAEGKTCTINDDVSRLLGVEPGKYNFDIDSLTCVRNKDGFCHHYPPPKPLQPEASTQPWIAVNDEAIPTAAETEDCARINSVENWPTVNKRVWKQKQQKEKAKRMRLASENCDTLIELGMEDMVILNKNCSDDCSAILSSQGAEDKADSQLVDNKECNDFSEPETLCLSQPEQLCLPESDPMTLPEPNAEPYAEVLPQPQTVNFLTTEPVTLLNSEPVRLLNTDTTGLLSSDTDSNLPPIKYPLKNGNHMQFHSAHFDIRSSPIKTSSTVFRKFQINTELLAKYEQTMRSIETVDKEDEPDKETTDTSVDDTQNTVTLNHEDTLQEIFRDEDLSAVKESFTLDRELKDWILNRSNDDKSEDGFSKTNTLIEPALLHIKDNEIKTSMNNEIDQKDVLSSGDNHDESSVLNFLDTLANDLSYPGTEIRTNNGDFQLDLFSFTSS